VSLRAPALDSPQAIRRATRDLLSLALIDARNRTLRWLEVFERRGLDGAAPGGPAPSVRWLAGHAGWYQDWWIGRHLQRGRGPSADPGGARLASVDPAADGWYGPTQGDPADAAAVRLYLAETLDVTLDLLAAAGDSDDALHFYRAALLHEDRLGETLAERAASAQLAREPDPPPPFAYPPARVDREALWLPAARLRLGSEPGGFVPDNELGAETIAVPEFEIDAQAVSWERFIEFAEDGGYDERGFWSPAGWDWLQRVGRRAPRDVEQLRGGVLLQRGGALQRAPAGQPVLHVTRHEAEAWCRWAGRRLPTEPEWELAAMTGGHRGFVWGDVFEWVAGSARPYQGNPGFTASPGSLDRMPTAGGLGVLRGASTLSPERCRHPKARRFLALDADHAFCGFRSCAC
jgi:gamma-glutamyl hercynylcysteine S-oxide synthase